MTQINQLAYIRAHAQVLRGHLQAQDTIAGSCLIIFRSLYVSHDEVVSASIYYDHAQLRRVEVQHRAQAGKESTSVLHNPAGLQPEEIAIFCGLDDVPLLAHEWVIQRIDMDQTLTPPHTTTVLTNTTTALSDTSFSYSLDNPE